MGMERTLEYWREFCHPIRRRGIGSMQQLRPSSVELWPQPQYSQIRRQDFTASLCGEPSKRPIHTVVSWDTHQSRDELLKAHHPHHVSYTDQNEWLLHSCIRTVAQCCVWSLVVNYSLLTQSFPPWHSLLPPCRLLSQMIFLPHTLLRCCLDAPAHSYTLCLYVRYNILICQVSGWFRRK